MRCNAMASPSTSWNRWSETRKILAIEELVGCEPKGLAQMVLGKTNLEPKDNKDICRSSSQYLKQVDGYWRTGSYKLKTRLARCSLNPRFPIGDDFISDYDETSDVRWAI